MHSGKIKPLLQLHMQIDINVNVYSPNISKGSAGCTIYAHGIGTHSFITSSPLRRIQRLRTTMLQL